MLVPYTDTAEKRMKQKTVIVREISGPAGGDLGQVVKCPSITPLKVSGIVFLVIEKKEGSERPLLMMIILLLLLPF